MKLCQPCCTLSLMLIVVAMMSGLTHAAEKWVVYDGFDGPGKGKKIVLIAGDDEYRSEEGLPLLGKILAKHHGFTCTMLFSQDDDGTINPGNQKNIPGLEALEDADLMIMLLRFRNLPDDQMQKVDNYLKSGRPVIGLRTSTHAFNIRGKSSWSHYGNGYRGDKKEWADGFGRLVLGEKWISHHGGHKSESTRGVIAEDMRDHPIVKVCDDVWGNTDVYGVRLPLPEGCQPLVYGQVLKGMKPDSPAVEGKKNDPMMPVAWIKPYQVPGGKQGKVFNTTMGSSTDLVNEGLRRLLVNAAYWSLGMEDKIDGKAHVEIVGKYEPSMYGFGSFKKGVKPADHKIQ